MNEQRSGASTLVLVLASLLFLGGTGMLAYVFLRSSGPTLAGVDPGRVRAGDAITVKGQGFAPTPQGNIVLFGDQTGRVISATVTELRVEVPELPVADGATQNVGLRVLVGRTASAAFDLAVYKEAPPVLPPPVQEPVEEPVPEATPEPVVVAAAPPQAAAPAPAPARTPRPVRPAPVATPAPPAVTLAAEPPPAPAEPVVTLAPLPRRFLLDRTAAESRKRVSGGLAGFDSTSVDLKRAPDVLGRVWFDVSPGQVKPGDRYTVNVFLINDGAKAIGIKQVFVATSVNGRLSSSPMVSQSDQVAPKARVLLGALSDVWRDSTTAWAMDVTVTTDRGDVYKNQIVWK
jgi:hypothetical protein